MKRVLVLISEAPGGTSSNLFGELLRVIEPHCDVRIRQVQAQRRLMLRLIKENIRAMWGLFWAETVVLHVFAASWTPTLVLAWLMRRKVVIFQWDVYPITMSGKALPISRLRRFADRVERWLLARASVLIVPSEDFRPFVDSKKVGGVIPLWPQHSLIALPHMPLATDGGRVRIGFAGQIHQTRGLLECLQQLQRVSVHGVEVHLYSGSPMPELVGIDAQKVQVTYHGRLERGALQADLRTMHFGLMSLSPELDQPGYPSKVYDYLAAGLPVLYFGRALPAFTLALADAGLGETISDVASIDLSQTYHALSMDFDSKREVYLARCALRWSALAGIL